jgi:hypothetical protein
MGKRRERYLTSVQGTTRRMSFAVQWVVGTRPTMTVAMVAAVLPHVRIGPPRPETPSHDGSAGQAQDDSGGGEATLALDDRLVLRPTIAGA